MVASSDGGQTFSRRAVPEHGRQLRQPAERRPRSSSSARARRPGRRGRTARTTRGAAGVTPGPGDRRLGRLRHLANASPAADQIVTERGPPGGVHADVPGPANSPRPGDQLGHRLAIQDNPVNVPSTTDFPINVNVTDPRFLSLSNLTANRRPDPDRRTSATCRSSLQPARRAAACQPITLVSNQINAARQQPRQLHGASGREPRVPQRSARSAPRSTTTPPRNIVDINDGRGRGPVRRPLPARGREPRHSSTAARPPAPANSPNSVNGTWTLHITNYAASNAGSPRGRRPRLHLGPDPGR